MNFEELLTRIGGEYPPLEISKKTTALVLIDMQVLALSDYIVWEAVQAGIDKDEAKEALKDYDERFGSAIKRAQSLLQLCREKGIRPIHVKIQSYTGDAADTGHLHKNVNFYCPPDSEWSQWIKEVEPLPDEAVLIKTCSGAVVGTCIERVLRNMGIQQIMAVGFYTDQCVETTVRDLADCGFDVTLVTDATMTQTMKRYYNTLENIVNVYCRGESSVELMERIHRL